MNYPTWTILIPTIARRAELLQRLLDGLLPQLDAHDGRVRVLAYLNHGVPSLGGIRDALVDAAETEYVSFIDDDDTVPGYFVDEAVRALATRPDKIGFFVDCYENGVFKQTGQHTINGPRAWRRWRGILHRDVSHLDPTRTEIARQGRFTQAKSGRAEDIVWVRQVRDLIKTEVFIHKNMYNYMYDLSETSWQRPVVSAPQPRLAIEHPFLSWHPDSD